MNAVLCFEAFLCIFEASIYLAIIDVVTYWQVIFVFEVGLLRSSPPRMWLLIFSWMYLFRIQKLLWITSSFVVWPEAESPVSFHPRLWGAPLGASLYYSCAFLKIGVVCQSSVSFSFGTALGGAWPSLPVVCSLLLGEASPFPRVHRGSAWPLCPPPATFPASSPIDWTFGCSFWVCSG